MKQNFKNVKDSSIGMGLACSHTISRALGGEAMIKFSTNGLTVLMFRIPVIYDDSLDQSQKSKVSRNKRKTSLLELKQV